MRSLLSKNCFTLKNSDATILNVHPKFEMHPSSILEIQIFCRTLN